MNGWPGQMMANLFGGTGNPEGLASWESRGARGRQGAGDVANLQCPRETAAERDYQNRSPHGNRRNARDEAEDDGAVVSRPTVERRGWRRRHVQTASRRRGVGMIADGKGRVCPRRVQLQRTQASKE